MVNFPMDQIPDCDSSNPGLLDFFLSSDASICSTMAFSPLGNSDHVVVSVFVDFLSDPKQDVPFQCIDYDYYCADWDDYIIWEMFHVRISLNSVLLLLVNFVCGFKLKLMYISLIINIRSNFTHLHGFQLLVQLP